MIKFQKSLVRATARQVDECEAFGFVPGASYFVIIFVVLLIFSLVFPSCLCYNRFGDFCQYFLGVCFMSDSCSRFFEGVSVDGIVELMESDAFFARLEYPGGYWQLLDDISSGAYASGADFLNASEYHDFGLTGKTYRMALDRLASKFSVELAHKAYFNFNTNFSPFLSYIDDRMNELRLTPVATIGVGSLDDAAPVSDLYFMVSALALCHAARHFSLLFRRYTGSGQGKAVDRKFAIAHLALQGNERYGRRNYNTYPLELDAEFHAIFTLGGILQEYGVDGDLISDRLTQAEALKADRFFYFIPEMTCKSGRDGFHEMVSLFREYQDKSFHFIRKYNVLEDASDLVLRIFDDPKWECHSKKFFSEMDGHQKDRMMACLVKWFFFGED